MTDVEVSRTSPSGRVSELRIMFERGDVRVPEQDVRSVLRPEINRQLGSAAFQLSVTNDGGQISRLVAAGAGWGHGVRLCQCGAVWRTRSGPDYPNMLA